VTSVDLTDTARVPGAFALEARGVSKRFGGTQALDGASLFLQPGTVHALLGGNGSGKSSMVKCLAGVYRADAGQVRVHGHRIDAADITPSEAHDAGLRVVHQDLGLFDHISIEENFAFDSGFPTGVGGHIEWRALRRQVADLLEQYGIHARPRDLVGSLRPAQKTLVAIARALREQSGSEFILLLDEPTASLPRHESETLLAALRERAANGQTIAFVSHRLQEVRAVSDEITVYRDGKVAGTLPGNAPEDAVVALIAGPGRMPSAAPQRRSGTAAIGAAVLEVEHLTVGPLRDLSLSVDAGEIVGVAGLLGSGRSTLLDVVFGARRPDSGRVVVADRTIGAGGIKASMRLGVAHVPENRLRDAVFASLSVRENASATVIRGFWTGWMRTGRERTETRDLNQRFNVKTTGTEAPILSLSGGNQQKVVLARWLRRAPRLLLLDEPTQGVDVIAREEIYGAVRDAAGDGCGVLIASSDHEELVAVCDRVVVLADGASIATLTGDDLTPERLTQLVQSARHAVEATS
jgi:ABC-type sugar transport system ATPase subunit